MITSCVVDASVALAWVNPAQGSDATDDLLIQMGTGMEVVVPPIWFLEVANALLVLERRKKLTKVERVDALLRLIALKLSTDQECERFVFTTTSEVATKYGLSVYDASYLEVALRRKLALATRDEPLRQAAKRAGVKLVF